jgi:uncharacterized protein
MGQSSSRRGTKGDVSLFCALKSCVPFDSRRGKDSAASFPSVVGWLAGVDQNFTCQLIVAAPKLTGMLIGHANVDHNWIQSFCERHQLAELSLFGSVLRDDFSDASDIDVLFELLEGQTMTLEKFLEMKDQLEEQFGREIDLVERKLVTNPFRRKHILENRRTLYVRPAA